MINDLTPDLAAEKIKETVLLFTEYENQRLTLEIERLLMLCAAYCHIDKIPLGLSYDVSNIIIKKIENQKAAADMSNVGNLKKLRENDVEFEWDVISESEFLADNLFESLKPKLNLYRKLVAW